MLSTGVLRFPVVGWEEGRLKLGLETPLPPDFMLAQACLSEQGQRATVLASGPDEIRLDQDWPSATRIEVLTGLPAPIVGAHLLTGRPLHTPLPKLELRLASTRGTNALLEKKTAPVALFVSAGFQDLLLIGDQTRPDLFALNVVKPAPLFKTVIEVPGRLSSDGRELQPLGDLGACLEHAQRAWQAGCRVACVALLHSYRNSAHELALAGQLTRLGFQVVCSAQVSPFINYLRRTESALIEAALTPVMADFLTEVGADLSEDSRLLIMKSDGGLSSVRRFRPKDSLLSGPAGGVLGAAAVGLGLGWDRLLAVDMGGTSTDVSRYSGSLSYQSEHRVGTARLQASSLRIETVAAGGGSICRFADGQAVAGPESAGASPGPACYGQGGPLTLTDVHCLLGRLSAKLFAIPLDQKAAQCAWNKIKPTDGSASGEPYLEGFLRLADERMADAIRDISLREGHDCRDHALLAFGGAGGLHACSLADLLGIRRILFPSEAGILSARGLRQASLEAVAERQVLLNWSEAQPQLESWLDELRDQARQALKSDLGELESEQTRETVLCQVRFVGQESGLSIPLGPDLVSRFHEEYRRVFGHDLSREIELERIQLRLASRAASLTTETLAQSPAAWDASQTARQKCWVEGRWREVPTLHRRDLPLGCIIDGPAIIADEHATLYLAPQWVAQRGDQDSIVLLRHERADAESSAVSHPAAVETALFTQRFRNVVEVMGSQLRRSALSTNVKERLDFSCCLLDAQGRLVANAPHIPVHLGAMGLCVRSVMAEIPACEGDVILTNHPAFGGSHLPDLTVITPVYHDGQLLAYLANRAHHAEIGGRRPGSMPPGESALENEGQIIAPCRLFATGESRFEEISEVLRSGPYPTRALADNLADLRAQVAANRAGQNLLLSLADQHGMETLLQQMLLLREQAAKSVREWILKLPIEPKSAEEFLDDGTRIRVSLTRQEDRLRIDFSGTSASHPGNLHATPAIIRSAVIYVVRLLQSDDLPLNEGLLDPIDIELPPCFLNPDFHSTPAPAVVGGNVETSQRVVDTLLKALGVVACSQGTMNNLIFGNSRVSYYETIGGGAGAGPGFVGASGTHTHMTNTAITDPEVLEHRFPVRLWRFGFREGSGGAGAYRGGDGIVRELEFLEPVSVSLLTQHRKDGPYGVAGGQAGQPGKQTIRRANGQVELLPSLASVEVEAGDRLIVETPGGGAWGGS